MVRLQDARPAEAPANRLRGVVDDVRTGWRGRFTSIADLVELLTHVPDDASDLAPARAQSRGRWADPEAADVGAPRGEPTSAAATDAEVDQPLPDTRRPL